MEFTSTAKRLRLMALTARQLFGWRIAKLDKYEDMCRAEIEDWSEDNDDE